MARIQQDKGDALRDRSNGTDLVSLDSRHLANTDRMPPAGMELEEGGVPSVGSKTLDVGTDWPLFTEPWDGPATVVTIEDAITTLTTGAKEATKIVGIVRTKVTAVL